MANKIKNQNHTQQHLISSIWYVIFGQQMSKYSFYPGIETHHTAMLSKADCQQIAPRRPIQQMTRDLNG
jgi:hypothetical protein